MSAAIGRFGSRRWTPWLIVLLLAAGIAAPAAATPVTVFFDGPSGFGVSAASAAASDVPYEYLDGPLDFLGSASGVLRVVSQELQLGSIDPFPPALSGNSVTSIWTVANESSTDLLGDTYLLFVTSVPYPIGGEVVEYDDARVGLVIDPELGWVLVRTSRVDQDSYYYPAISLGSLEAGATAAPFAVNYVVDQPIEQVVTTWVLPELASGMGFRPIPEPSAGVLVGFGLALLAVSCRLRS